MTILLTGGTGLVGPRILKRLVEAGIDCRALVRPGKDVPTGVTAIEGDVLSPDSLAAAVEGVTSIVHLAALFRTPDEDKIWKVNLDGTRNLISGAKEHNPDVQFLMASTSNVYDPDITHPGREDDEVSPTLAMVASMKWHPAQKLSVIHHEDIATAFEFALTGVMDGRIVNIADESPLTMYEIAQILDFSYEESSEPLSNPWKGHMDVTLARSLGFQPKVATIYQAVREGKL